LESPLRPFSFFVVLPPGLRRGDIFLLALFRPASNQDHESVTIFPEVNPIARTKINPILVDTTSNSLGVGKIALLHPRQRSGDFDCSFSV
jgi:hypothetical protein